MAFLLVIAGGEGGLFDALLKAAFRELLLWAILAKSRAWDGLALLGDFAAVLLFQSLAFGDNLAIDRRLWSVAGCAHPAHISNRIVRLDRPSNQMLLLKVAINATLNAGMAITFVEIEFLNLRKALALWDDDALAPKLLKLAHVLLTARIAASIRILAASSSMNLGSLSPTRHSSS